MQSYKIAARFFFAAAILIVGTISLSAYAAGTNLVVNGDLEAGTTAPTSWTQDSWGTLTATFTYPVAGNGSAKAAQVKIATRTDGDAKWMHTAIPVTPGTTYTYSESYSATVATEVDIEYTSTTGVVSYAWLGDTPATGAAWGTFTNTITVPAGMKSMTVMHVIAAVGTLSIDNVSVTDGTTPPPPPPPPAAPVISTFTATPASISSGQSSTLAWSTINATSLVLSNGTTQNPVTGNSIVVSPTATTTYTLFAYNGGTATTSKQVTVNVATVVTPPPPPPPPPAQKPTISSFIATPASIFVGSSSVLSWTVANASSTSISTIGVVTGTSKSVTPAQTTQYVLTATNPAGSVAATTTVTVTTPPPPPPPPSSNLIANGTLEAGTTAPTGWQSDYWGTMKPTFTYPVAGKNGGKAAKVTVANWKSGDAKWWFNHVNASSNTVYKYTEDYIGTVISNVTVEFKMQNGTYQYQWVANEPVATTWTPFSIEITVPRGAVSFTVLHALDKNGTLTIDNAVLTALPANPFPTGMVTLTFDDGLKSQFTNARPILNTAGIKAGYYIITTEPASGDTAYMTWANITTIKTEGNEVGGHSRTHPDLSAITAAAAQTEIKGSYTDLVAHGITPKAFVYPVGGVNPAVETMVQNAGYTVARGSYWGMNTPTADKYALYDIRLDKTTTFAQAKAWIDQAIADKRWVVFELHDVLATGGDDYAISTALFQQIVTYIKSSGIKTVTLEQGRALMQ